MSAGRPAPRMITIISEDAILCHTTSSAFENQPRFYGPVGGGWLLLQITCN